MKHNEKMENLKEWENTAVNQEFTYPMWFQNKSFGHVVKFEGLTVGEVVHGFENWFLDYTKSDDFPPHTNVTIWEQVENPNLATDKEIEQVINEEYEKDNSINNGGKTDIYQLPSWVKDCDDFAEWRNLNGFQFNILKAGWTFNTQRHSGTNALRDINKIIHYANREKQRILKELKNEN